MKITLNFEANSLPKKNGTFPIFLRATENGRHSKKALDVYVTDRRNFDPRAKRDNWVSTKEPLAKVFNSRLSSTLEAAYKTMIELERREELSAYSLIMALKGDNSESFTAFVDRKIKQYEDKRQIGSALGVSYFKKKLLLYTHNREVLFRDLNFSFVNGFVTFMTKQTTTTGEPLSPATVHNEFTKFQTLYRQAVTEGMITTQNNPFDKIKVKRGNTHRVGLAREEVERIVNLDLEERTKLWHVRNYFLFSMYMAGIRIGDLMNLRWSNVVDGRLVYSMQKTKSPRSIPIVEQARHILELYRRDGSKPTDYIFPILTRYKQPNSTEIQRYKQKTSRTAAINCSLKKIAEMAGIEKNLSCHISRHTFANIASESGNVYMISQLLGHSDTATTQIYLNSINPKQQDEFMTNVFK